MSAAISTCHSRIGATFRPSKHSFEASLRNVFEFIGGYEGRPARAWSRRAKNVSRPAAHAQSLGLTAMELQQYLDTVANQLVNELTPILDIKSVTANTDLLGKY